MNITYVLGNGFDLHNGLKTKYGDFYRYLEKLADKEKELPDEKKRVSNNQIYKAIKKDGIEKWSDYEDKIGEILSSKEEVEKIDDIKKFIEKDFFTIIDLLEQYLLMEIDEKYSKQLQNENNLSEILVHMFNLKPNIESYLLNSNTGAVTLEKLDQHIEKIDIKDFQYNILTLNYTTYLDSYMPPTVEETRFFPTRGTAQIRHIYNKPLHLHGDVISKNTLLGVENNRNLMDLHPEIQNIIKKRNHETYIHEGIPDLRKATPVIENTDVFIFFGVSFGVTDEDLIKQIYTENSHALSIIHIYSSDKNRFEKKEEVEKIKRQIRTFLGKEDTDQLENFLFIHDAEAVLGSQQFPKMKYE